MKKSKIIVPALGILLLSTAASISGTVAWFTASRTFSTHVNAFSVGSVDGNLSGVCAGVVGTKAGTKVKTNDQILFATGESSVVSVLTDGSYDSSAKTLYTDDAVVSEANDGLNNTKFVSKGTASEANWKAGTKDSKNYYYAVQWTITLSYEGSALDNDVHILFDEASSEFYLNGSETAATPNGATSTVKVANGIRFCLNAGSGENEKTINYAPLRTGTIKNVASTTGVEDTTPLIDGDDTITKLEDNVATATAKSNAAYLGTIAYNGSLVVTVTCWLDGLDADVLTSNLADFTSIAGKLCFYCRTAAAA